jgi:N-acetylglucosaminyldiphosphoundecaprenol N-acetyl-beta-D-mannosaminyltransferase
MNPINLITTPRRGTAQTNAGGELFAEPPGRLRIAGGPVAPGKTPEVRTVRLMGAPLSEVSESDAVRLIVDAAIRRRGHWTITANLDHLRRYTRDAQARRLIDGADMVVADGTPLIWASRLAGVPLPERVAGSDMIWSICEAVSRHRGSVFLLGGEPGVAVIAARVLAENNPGLAIAGTSCPPMGFEEDAQEVDRIAAQLRATAPQIVLVALGFPKQDLLISRLRHLLPGASFIGVGISLSFVAGEMSRAPKWTQQLGLEWLNRLLKEPRRLGRRYLLQGMPFALELFASGFLHRIRIGGQDARWGWDHADRDQCVPGAE